MFTDHKKFAAAPAAPVVYGLPAKPKSPVAHITYNPLDGYLYLFVFGVRTASCPRFSNGAEALYVTANKINAAAKEKGL